MTERIGIFGGTFDPPHNGHLILALDAHDDLNLDRVLFVVNNDPWQKEGTVEAEAFHRLIMTDIALAETFWSMQLPWAEVSTIEVDRGGPSHTIETLEDLSAPNRELFLLIGSDLIPEISTWERYKEIPDYCRVHPVERWVGISSTRVRQRIRDGQSLRRIVPDDVITYIEKTGLYKSRTDEQTAPCCKP